MDFIKRLLANRSAPEPLEAFQIRFANEQSLPAVRVPSNADPYAVIQALGLPYPTPTIVISGGAAKADLESVNAARSTIEDGLARFLDGRQLSLIDGGTASGVMQLIGEARQRRGYTFSLIGIAPELLIGYPGHETPHKLVELDANHTHFVLTSGDQFGAESELIFHFADALAGDQKRLVVIVNGGEIVKREAHRCATHKPRFPLLVLEGSGRFADELAAARTTTSSDPMIRAILDQGIVHFLPVNAGADNLYRWLENFFGY